MAAFNKLAVPLFEAAGWSIVDGYATTTTRPDAAELRPRGRVGAAFVHFDPDVVSTLHNRQMMAAGLLQSCPTIVNEECQ